MEDNSKNNDAEATAVVVAAVADVAEGVDNSLDDNVSYVGTFYIYKITNQINGKIYIGQTNNPYLRWAQYKSAFNTSVKTGVVSSQLITRAMVKYGVDSFVFEEIAKYGTQDEVNDAEVEFIRQFDSRNHEIGYNIDLGGKQEPRSPETIKKVSEALKKYYETHDGTRKGVVLSDETKKRISESSMGKAGTNTGKTFSEEWKTRMGRAQSGGEVLANRRFSPEQEKEICRLYVEDKRSTLDIAKQFNCGKTLVGDILKREKVIMRRSHKNEINMGGQSVRRFTDEIEKEICYKYKNNFITMVKLAEEYNCGRTTVRDILLRNGVKL